MIPMKLSALLLASAMLQGSPVATADGEASRAAVKSAMEATGFAFDATASGLSWEVRFDHGEGREISVFVGQLPGTAGGRRLHSIYVEVWSGGDTAPDGALLRRVLAQARKLGGYFVFRDRQGRWAIRFGTQIDSTDLPPQSHPGDLLATRLHDLIDFVDAVGFETVEELKSAGR